MLFAFLPPWHSLPMTFLGCTQIRLLLREDSDGNVCLKETDKGGGWTLTWGNMVLSKAKVAFKVASAASADGSVAITLTTDKVAVYVTLTTLANGRFSDNAFLLLPSKPMQVDFVPFGALDMATLTKSLRVEDVSAYM